MGAQSTFFGPLKFSILPQHLHEDELVAGNGFVSAGTYIAILTGTLCGGLFILRDLGRIYISCGVVGVANCCGSASLPEKLSFLQKKAFSGLFKEKHCLLFRRLS